MACLLAAAAGLTMRSAVDPSLADGALPGDALAEVVHDLSGEPVERTLRPYEGLGAWVDVFDYAPAYSGEPPTLDTRALDAMATEGVRTVYLQAARNDDRSPDMIVDRDLVGRWLIEAHRRGLAVVAWYLPTFTDVERDLAHLEALRDFRALGHTFDGVAVDIEARTVEDAAERSRRLVELSRRYREIAPGEAVGAIVLPPVLLEVVNPNFWPGFPWAELAPHYDVWLPMAYWSQRTTDSGYKDGYTYVEESTRRMREALGLPDAPVHNIGGIGDALLDAEIIRFGDALADTASIGGSMYDWATLPPTQRQLVREAVAG